jgi:hypothetical protein
VDLPDDLPTETPNSSLIEALKRHKDAPYILLSDPHPIPAHIYCSICRKWVKISTTSANIQGHIERKMHSRTTSQSPIRTAALTDSAKRSAIKQAILLNGLPLSMIECPQLKLRAPGLPTRQRFTDEIPTIADATKRALKIQLSDAEYMSVQFDGWEDHRNRRFIGVTCHALCRGRFQSSHLATVPCKSLHVTADYIAREVDCVLQDFNIHPVACSTDTNATERKAVELLNIMRTQRGEPKVNWFPCVCHLLNLTLKAFCLGSHALLSPMRDLQRSLGHSGVFSQFCVDEGATRTTIPEANATRWSSIFSMVRGIGDLRNEIVSFKPDVEETISLAEQLLPILDLFRQAFDLFQSERFGTICEIRCAFVGLRRHLATVPLNWQPGAVAAMAKLDELEQEHSESMHPLIALAARVNPNFDPNVVFTIEERQRIDDAIIRSLTELMGSAQTDSQEIIDEAFIHSKTTSDRVQRVDLLSFARISPGPSHAAQTKSPAQELQASIVELSWRLQKSNRLTTEATFSDLDILSYWLEKRQEWPALSRFALGIVTRPCSSATTERHFRLTGQIEGIKRTRLLPDHVSELAMIMGNASLAEKVITES